MSPLDSAKLVLEVGVPDFKHSKAVLALDHELSDLDRRQRELQDPILNIFKVCTDWCGCAVSVKRHALFDPLLQ